MMEKIGDKSAENGKEKLTEDAYKELLTNELDRQGLGGIFVWSIFFLCVTPNILNGFHVSSYTLLGHLPDDQWCGVTNLKDTNWTIAQQRNITEYGLNAKGCSIWDWDYGVLGSMNYEQAINYTANQGKPAQTSCSSHGAYEYAHATSTFVADWDLVCDKAIQRTSAQVAISLGKFMGSFSFGIFADKYGRKTSFTLGAAIFIAASFLCTFSPWYSIFLVGRFGLGCASSGLFYPALTIIVENICLKHRTWMSLCFSTSYPVGMILLAVASSLIEPWRYLQLSLTIPSLLLILNCYLMDESPRWLIAEKKYEQGYKVLFKKKSPFQLIQTVDNSSMIEKKNTEEEHTSLLQRIKEGPMKQFIGLFATWKMRRMIFTSYFMFCVTSLSYYVTALNASNMAVSRNLFVLITGLVDLPSYLVPVVMLRKTGRQMTTMILFLFSGIALLLVLAIPTAYTVWIVGFAMLGRFGISATYSIVTMYTAELYPTEIRNSALGTCSTWAHVGSISAPYVVDVLGVIGWYIPTTICGCCVIVAGILTLTLPETGSGKLADHVDEVPPKNTTESTSKQIEQ